METIRERGQEDTGEILTSDMFMYGMVKPRLRPWTPVTVLCCASSRMMLAEALKREIPKILVIGVWLCTCTTGAFILDWGWVVVGWVRITSSFVHELKRAPFLINHDVAYK